VHYFDGFEPALKMYIPVAMGTVWEAGCALCFNVAIVHFIGIKGTSFAVALV
jgi:hypothetical protein